MDDTQSYFAVNKGGLHRIEQWFFHTQGTNNNDFVLRLNIKKLTCYLHFIFRNRTLTKNTVTIDYYLNYSFSVAIPLLEYITRDSSATVPICVK